MEHQISVQLGSSHPEVFCKKSVLRNFVKFAGKHLCQSLFFNKVTVLRPLWHRCFPVKTFYFEKYFSKFLRTPFLTEHIRWLFLVTFMNKKYTCHIRLVKQALKHGLILKKVHRVIKRKQRNWIEKYIGLNTKYRTKSLNNFKKDFYGFLNNSIFGKTIQNNRKQRDTIYYE